MMFAIRPEVVSDILMWGFWALIAPLITTITLFMMCQPDCDCNYDDDYCDCDDDDDYAESAEELNDTHGQ